MLQDGLADQKRVIEEEVGEQVRGGGAGEGGRRAERKTCGRG